MTDQLITFETAKLSKEKGFDLINHLKNGLPPTQSLLQKWLRENHNIHIVISPTMGAIIVELLNPALTWGSIPPQKSYEEALEAGLIEALKLINLNP